MPLSVRPEPIRTASEAAPRLVWPNSCPEPSNTRSGSPLATLTIGETSHPPITRLSHPVWACSGSSHVPSTVRTNLRSDYDYGTSLFDRKFVLTVRPCAEHGEDELAIEQRCPVVVVRIVAVCECLVGVLIDAGIIKTVSVGCVGIQRKTLVCADAIRGEGRVVIGESETRPKEQTTADLRGCGGSRSQPECRLDALKDVAHALVGDL